MASLLEIKISGIGTRKELADALKLISEDLYGPDAEEIYNIDAAEYMDCSVVVELKDKDSE